MTQALTMVVYVLGPLLLGVVGVVVRLRWQAVRDRYRQDTARAWVSHLPAAGVLELHDVRDDGSYLHVRFATADRTGVQDSHE